MARPFSFNVEQPLSFVEGAGTRNVGVLCRRIVLEKRIYEARGVHM